MSQTSTTPAPAPTEEEELWNEIGQAEEAGDPAFAKSGESDNDDITDEAAADAAAQSDARLWERAPPDLRAAHDAQVKALEQATNEHSRRSIEGRIAYYTRRLQERNDAAAQPRQPVQQRAATAPLAELAAEYPEIAKPLEQTLAPLAEKLSRFEAQEQSRQQAADAEMDNELIANEYMLEQRHPGWDKYLNEYGPVFGAWIVDQPLYLRQAFVNNKEAIIDPYSAIETMDAFKEFVALNQSPGGNPEQQQRLNPRRAAQLAGSASPQTGRSRPTVSGIPEDGDPEMIWNSFRDIDPEEKKYRSA